MIYLLGGYIWLFIHRPFEVWSALGSLHMERLYMLLTIGVWVISPKRVTPNRLNAAFAVFAAAVLASWVFSPWPDVGRPVVEDYLKVCVFYVLLVTSVQNERQLRTLLAMYLGALALYMLHSLWEYQNGRHVFRMGIIRMVGVDTAYSDPNTRMTDVLLDSVTRSRGYFRTSVVRRLLDEHRGRRMNHGERLWALLVFELWHREHLDARAAHVRGRSAIRI